MKYRELLRAVSLFTIGAMMLAAPTHAAVETAHVSGLQGSLVLKSMPLSEIVHRKITTWVYLPLGYNRPENANERYPVVYLLHGQPGGWTDCFRSGEWEKAVDGLISTGQMRPVILVAFDGDGPHGSDDMTNFCNRATDGYRAEDFIVNDLVPYVDTVYRTIPDAGHRALMGYSGGGYGALNLGLRHPDVWNVLVSHAGFYQPSDDPHIMTKILGTAAGHETIWAQNSPLVNVKNLPSPSGLHVYMDAAPKEEDYDGFQAMSQALRECGTDLMAISRQKAHAWKVVSQNCRDSFLFVNKAFSAS